MLGIITLPVRNPPRRIRGTPEISTLVSVSIMLKVTGMSTEMSASLDVMTVTVVTEPIRSHEHNIQSAIPYLQVVVECCMPLPQDTPQRSRG